jgi:hypothetical protein
MIGVVVDTILDCVLLGTVPAMDIAGVRTQLRSVADGLPVGALAGQVGQCNAVAVEVGAVLRGTGDDGVIQAVPDLLRASELVDGVRARLAVAADRLTGAATVL